MKLDKAMAKAFVPAAQLQRPASPVINGPAVAPMQSAMLKTAADMEERIEEIQYLRARIQNMPQVNGQASSGSAASFGWLAGFIASVGFAVVRKYTGQESAEGSQISLVPQRAGLVQ